MDIDWSKAPTGQTEGAVTISGSSGPVVVKLSATKATVQQSRQAQECFGGLAGPIAFTADQAAKNVPAGKHMLKITMVDPTVVLQSVVIHDAPLPPSYFGPQPGVPNGAGR